MENKLTAREWAKEIQNKFILFYELFNDELTLSCKAEAKGNSIVLYIDDIDGVDLNSKKNAKAISGALDMAARGCPYEYSYSIK